MVWVFRFNRSPAVPGSAVHREANLIGLDDEFVRVGRRICTYGVRVRGRMRDIVRRYQAIGAHDHDSSDEDV